MVLLVFSAGVLTAQKDEHRVRNVVLVHGAWADGSGWRGVYDILYPMRASRCASTWVSIQLLVSSPG